MARYHLLYSRAETNDGNLLDLGEFDYSREIRTGDYIGLTPSLYEKISEYDGVQFNGFLKVFTITHYIAQSSDGVPYVCVVKPNNQE